MKTIYTSGLISDLKIVEFSGTEKLYKKETVPMYPGRLPRHPTLWLNGYVR